MKLDGAFAVVPAAESALQPMHLGPQEEELPTVATVEVAEPVATVVPIDCIVEIVVQIVAGSLQMPE